MQSILKASKAAVSKQETSSTQTNKTVVTDSQGNVYVKINMAKRHYRVTANKVKNQTENSLVDRGANGGLGGDDMRVIETVQNAKADVSGITNNVAKNLDIVLGASLIKTNRGMIIGLFPQYAYLGKGKTIHSCIQMEAFGLMVDERSRKVQNPGRQMVQTPDGYKIPIKIRNGLPYMDMKYPSEEDLDTFPHVYFTADTEWDPSIMDDEFDDFDEQAFEDDDDDLAFTSPVNDFGELTGDLETDIDIMILEAKADLAYHKSEFIINENGVKQKKVKPKFEAMRRNFLWVSPERIKKTLQATTQFARSVGRIPFRKHYKTRWPAANVNRFNDDVATDTFFQTPRL